jgi:adenylylsulfate kinase-like enzyme
MNYKGIWFYGFSGSGKSYISDLFKKDCKNPFIIDGDVVRATLSTDLDYSIKSRKIQIERIFNIAKISIFNNYFPIISTVYMNKSMLNKCNKNLIAVIKVERANFNLIKSTHKTYKNKKNVVGRDIKLNNINSHVLKNSGDNKVLTEIKFLRKLLKKN